jgi:alpha-glucosidase (family GH31 glycosyl hydrolase)
MAGAIRSILRIALPGILPLISCLVSRAAVDYSLESRALRIEVIASPYSYRVIEKSTGDVLVSESKVAFTENKYVAKSATKTVNLAGRIDLQLHLEGTSVPAQVTFRFTKPEIVQVVLTFNQGIRAEIADEYQDQGEHYYGIWEMPVAGNMDNRGASHDFLGIRHEADINYSSARAPFYVTSGKYGIYVESRMQGRYSIALDGKTGFSFDDTQLKYDIIYGPSIPEVLNRYNALAGPAVMPPDWAFGTIWWRDDEHSDLRDASNAQEKVIQDADRLRALHLPSAAIWLDRPFGTGEMGWGNMDFDASFPDPVKMIKDLNDRGMKLFIWVANRAWNQLLLEGLARQYLYFGRGSATDMKSPEAYLWFKSKLNEYVSLGVKGYKIDRGEEDELPLADENLNAILFPKMAAEGMAEVYGNDYFNFSRNANDTARKYTAVWNGDTYCTFPSLEISIKTALRSGMINFPMWGSDTGGYIGSPNKDLFARWLEFSAFSPMMEILIGPNRTIWYDYDDELVRITKTFVGLHHDLIPFTRSYIYQATKTGMPVMRALTLEYPDDASVSDTWNEYLYGRELLVAPVTAPNAGSRTVYLPAGKWMNYNDRRTVYQGHASITADGPTGLIPLFVREGAIIPRGDIVRMNNNWDSNWSPKLRIEFYPAVNQASQFDYFTGKRTARISVTPQTEGVQIALEDLETDGILEIYCKRPSAVIRDGVVLRAGSQYQYNEQDQKLTLKFHGATTLALRGAHSLFEVPTAP